VCDDLSIKKNVGAFVLILVNSRIRTLPMVSFALLYNSNRFIMLERHKETMPTTCVGMNEWCFTLIEALSLYVNPKHVYGTRLLHKCYCLLLEVISLLISSMLKNQQIKYNLMLRRCEHRSQLPNGYVLTLLKLQYSRTWKFISNPIELFVK
jgi:hypothetical protein